MPSFEVASSCSVVIPLASKNAGIVLTFAGGAPFSLSHRESGVVKSSYVKKNVSVSSLVAVRSAAPSPGVGISDRSHALVFERQRRDAALHVVERLDQHPIPSALDVRERDARGGLEEHFDCAAFR